MSGRESLAGQRCWVIGASSGIGAALARELVSRGARVVVSARSADALEDVARGDMAVVAVDATDEEKMQAAAEQVRALLGGLDIVVWCAGYWEQFDAAQWDAESFEKHVRVNLLGLNNMLAAVIPMFIEQGHGDIVGVASVAGYRGLAGSEAYGATKAAQLNLLEGLRAALDPHGVQVTTVAPGFVRTPMTEDNEFPMPFIIEPDEAAREIADGLERGKAEIVFPLPMAVLMKTARALPTSIWSLIAARLGRKN